jgi:hypothetical protein
MTQAPAGPMMEKKSSHEELMAAAGLLGFGRG